MKKTKSLWLVPLVVSMLILILSYFAGQVHRSFKDVTIRDIQYVNVEGALQRGLLYIPKTATKENPAPAIVSCHGNNNTAEMQDIHAVELSRRGYVVLAVDGYRQGLSTQALDEASAIGDGAFAALQYIGTLPFVDKSNIGMVGHSKGSLGLVLASQAAYTIHQADPSVIVPRAIIPTGVLMLGMDDTTPFLTAPINMCVFHAEHDEFLGNIYPTLKGKDYNTLPIMKSVFGFDRPEYGALYAAGSSAPLDRAGAVAAGADGNLRSLISVDTTHPGLHFSTAVEEKVIEFFDITLRNGMETIPPQNQIWYWKQILTGIALVLFVFSVIPFGRLFLELPFFQAIIAPEPESFSVVSGKKDLIRYSLLAILSLIPAPALYLLCMNKWGAFVNPLFPLEQVNGFLVLNLVIGGCLLILFGLYYQFIYKKNGASQKDLTACLAPEKIWRSFLLAISMFAVCLAFIRIVDIFFKVDFRFWILSFCRMTPAKWAIYLRYVPSYFFFFAVTGLVYNMSARIRGSREWKTYVNLALQSMVGLLIFGIADYVILYQTGFLGSLGAFGSASSLAPLLVWNLVFILPVSAVITRYFFKKTGNIWTGAFINAFIAALFAVSNTIVSVGVL